MSLVSVDVVEPGMGTLWTAEGIRNSDGNRVRFGLDHRMGHGLLALVEEEGPTLCEVEPWQILRILPN